MNRRTVNLVIILGVLAVLGILMVQVIWIRKNESLVETNVEIQERQDSLNLQYFTESVNIALRNVLEDVSFQKGDSSDLYAAVKQINPAYFTVDINEELHPYYLENLLKREFYDQNIHHSFQYGIYDCFTDSIVYGNLLDFQTGGFVASITDSTGATSPSLSWKKDGHYFTVFFPGLNTQTSVLSEDEFVSPYWYLFLIVGLAIIFFGFAVMVILKQKRLSEVKTDFINNMTHELKTPISTIGLSSEMIMRSDFQNDEEKIRKYAALIFKENKRLQNQVERVLNVAKLDKNQISLSKEEMDINELLEEVKDNFDFNQTEKGGRITLELNAENYTLNADPVHISNVFYNLIDNAIKYCDREPQISIRTKNERNSLVVEIEDNGIGIKRDDQKMIFDKFYRVPTGNLHDVKGFGLGLYYVKIIIDAHEGDISLKSSPGKGTTFSIRLPL